MKTKSKKTSKKVKSKTKSKKNSKSKTITKTRIIEKVKYIPVEANFFSLADNTVFQILKNYRDTYEYIMNQSLEYKLEFTPVNHSLGESNVTYFKRAAYGDTSNPNINGQMHIVGYLDNNVFTWNEYQKARHYKTFMNYMLPLVNNINTIETFKKLFQYTQITFPERYRYTIPYLLSLMYDPGKANILRVSDNMLSDYNFTFICIDMPLNIPYWGSIKSYITNELNYKVYQGGAEKKNVRLLKDSAKCHLYKNHKKMMSKQDK
jgi:hypothetical protein